MSNEDNAVIQRDEIEALSAIYGDEWCVVDEEHKIYCIEVTDGQTKPVWKICLQVHLPENYPSEAPPEYQINAPWLRGDEKKILEASLADIYCENLGESIVYLWTERIREFLQAKVAEPNSQGSRLLSSERQVNLTTEVDHGDDFDLSLIETLSFHSDHSTDTSDHDWECPAITHGACVTDRRSTFQPHLAPVFHKCQIKMVLEKLYENKKIANATHNIYAYRITRNNVVLQGCEDDGETHAGSRMLHLLQILNAENVIVIVSRWYGGILLGPDRFKHINNCTRTILQECDYIKEKGDKKGPKSSGEKKKR